LSPNRNVRGSLSSGYSVEGGASEILENRGFGFIQKPFDTKHLSQKLSEVPGNKK
jgi:hypothetical protein